MFVTLGCFVFRTPSPIQALSTNGVFANVVAAGDGLLVKTQAPSASDTLDVLSYYSGSKSGYGINAQATVPATPTSGLARFPPSHQEQRTIGRHGTARAFRRLSTVCRATTASWGMPRTRWATSSSYPGRGLQPVWRPLKVQFAGRASLITALFHLRNFLRDEGDKPLDLSEEDENSGRHRPHLTANGTLPPDWQTAPSPSRSG